MTRPPDEQPTRLRLLAAAAAGILVGVAISITVGWRYGLLAGWMIAAAVFLIWTWVTIWPMNPRRTTDHAQREDPGLAAIDLTVLIAAVASLLAIALVLASPGNKVVQAGLGLGSVALAWAMVHTVFTTRYARLYYSKPAGGIEFNQDEPPQYSDFAYFAFTVGMTFQVSDTNIKTKTIRATTLRHALLSYLFGAVILATTINIVAGIGK